MFQPRQSSFEMKNRSKVNGRYTSAHKQYKQCNGYHAVGESDRDSNRRRQSESVQHSILDERQAACKNKEIGNQENGNFSNFSSFEGDNLFTVHEEESFVLEADCVSNPNEEKRKIHSLNVINNIARVLFPALFLLFNVVYWSTLVGMIWTNESYQLSSFFTSLEGPN